MNVNLIGRVRVKDLATGEILLDKMNAVHPQNMSTVIARAMGRDSNGSIFKIAFGNGGTFVNSSSQVVLRPPNTLGAATPYNQTYEVQVDEQAAGTPETNNVVSSASPSPAITSVVTVTVILGVNEPTTSTYTWDEIGLKSEDDLLLTHLIHEPVSKTPGFAKEIIYDILIAVS